MSLAVDPSSAPLNSADTGSPKMIIMLHISFLNFSNASISFLFVFSNILCLPGTGGGSMVEQELCLYVWTMASDHGRVWSSMWRMAISHMTGRLTVCTALVPSVIPLFLTFDSSFPPTKSDRAPKPPRYIVQRESRRGRSVLRSAVSGGKSCPRNKH